MRLKEIKPNTVIHCTTKDEVLFLLKMFPTNTLTIGLWNTYENETCLHLNENRTLSYGDCTFYFREGYKITEFSDLIIPELSAKEVLETLHDMCSFYRLKRGACSGCPADPYCISMSFKNGMDSFLDSCTKWREEHPKEEKKELEAEWVYVVRIIKVHDNGKKECVHEVVCNIEFSDMNKVAEAELKHYCSEHKGKFFANLNHICRIKE